MNWIFSPGLACCVLQGYLISYLPIFVLLFYLIPNSIWVPGGLLIFRKVFNKLPVGRGEALEKRS
jgi:hypothetical protein